ncbi:MAG: N-acetylmuramoyl-L-alanine amidase [Granulosicoccus sp.]
MLEASAIRHLVVHCSDTPDHEAMGAREIHQMHLGFGWHGIGYHRVINRDGLIEAARPDYWQGAHVYGHNEISLGVCLIGRHEFTVEQFDSLEAQLRQWQAEYPLATICGHRDFTYTDKTCPNFDVAAWCTSRGLATGPITPV